MEIKKNVTSENVLPIKASNLTYKYEKKKTIYYKSFWP